MSQQPEITSAAKRIYLLGFMGTGKSYWGKLWASHHGMSFSDIDEMIEQVEKDTITGIFENAGEDYFRVKEASILRDQVTGNDCIIACGGGLPCFYDNMKWMNEHGLTVFLSAGPRYILSKVLDEIEKRPLLKNFNEAELLFFIEQKLAERHPFYSQAKIVLDAESIDINSLDEIVASLNK